MYKNAAIAAQYGMIIRMTTTMALNAQQSARKMENRVEGRGDVVCPPVPR